MIRHSIIIPTAGRPVAIKAAIHSLLKVSPESDEAEIIVVDNNTAQDLAGDLQAFCLTLASRLRYVREPSPGLGAARHRGAAEARGELLTFIDDDVEVSEGWLQAIQRGFADPAVAMVGGPSIPKFTCSIPAWFWDYMGPTPYGGWACGWLSLLDIGKDIRGIDPNYIWGLNFSIRKQVMDACGGFHPDLVPARLQRWQGDGETGLTMKVKAAGYRADYLQDALLLHLCGPDRLNLEYFKKRAYFQGVCNSFTKIRGGQAPLCQQSRDARRSLYRRARAVAGGMLRRLQGRTSMWAADSAPIKRMTSDAEREGWLFHQREVAADCALLEWVRRADYFNTDIQTLSNEGIGQRPAK